MGLSGETAVAGMAPTPAPLANANVSGVPVQPSEKASGSTEYSSVTSTACSVASEPTETTLAEIDAVVAPAAQEPKTTTGGTSVRIGSSGT